jgi:GntR family transcriptional repressor for pyruvate dehydrogenase complex
MSKPPFRAIETKRLYRQIAEQIREHIDSGHYAPGERLPAERELAELLGVSRPSVREALIALEMEGLVALRAGTGVFVQEHRLRRRELPLAKGQSAPGPFDVLAARILVEAECAALAARHATPAQLRQLKSILAQMKVQSTHSPEAIALDEGFHLCIAEASGNAALQLLVQQLWAQRTGELYTQLESHFVGESIWQLALQEHEALVDAIAAKDASAARKAMQVHLRNAKVRFASNRESGG